MESSEPREYLMGVLILNSILFVDTELLNFVVCNLSYKKLCNPSCQTEMSKLTCKSFIIFFFHSLHFLLFVD